jgi:predicted O-methyltransferase YrrM
MKLFKRLVFWTLDRTVIPLLTYIAFGVGEAFPTRTVLQELALKTASECADFVREHMPKALGFKKREDLWSYVLKKKNASGLMAEFGVWNGYSINHFAKKTDQLVYGFDSFTGLKEDCSGWEFAKGHFDRGGELPRVEKNVRLIKGWLQDTLPPFLAEHNEPFAFIHVDTDTYEAAVAIFGLLETRIREGTIIVFDEYIGYRGWRYGEHQAFQEFVQRTQVGFEYLGFSNLAVAVRVTHRNGTPNVF